MQTVYKISVGSRVVLNTAKIPRSQWQLQRRYGNSTGTVVGYTRAKTTVLVLWDGNKTAASMPIVALVPAAAPALVPVVAQ